MVKLRLQRFGTKKKPFYRMVAADSKTRRDGPFIEIVGTYDPMKEPSETKVDLERAGYWLQKGAQPTARVKKLLEKAGLEINKPQGQKAA